MRNYILHPSLNIYAIIYPCPNPDTGLVDLCLLKGLHGKPVNGNMQCILSVQKT